MTGSIRNANAARIAGYAWGCAQTQPTSDFDADGAAVDWYGSAPVPADIEAAWYQGVRDSGAPDAFDYVSVEAAAESKGVAPNTLYRLLRDDERRKKHFNRTITRGEGKRRTYHLHIADVEAWQPGNTKPGKKSAD